MVINLITLIDSSGGMYILSLTHTLSLSLSLIGQICQDIHRGCIALPSLWRHSLLSRSNPLFSDPTWDTYIQLNPPGYQSNNQNINHNNAMDNYENIYSHCLNFPQGLFDPHQLGNPTSISYQQVSDPSLISLYISLSLYLSVCFSLITIKRVYMYIYIYIYQCVCICIIDCLYN